MTKSWHASLSQTVLVASAVLSHAAIAGVAAERAEPTGSANALVVRQLQASPKTEARQRRSCCGQLPQRFRLAVAQDRPRAFQATAENPSGMVWIPGGEFTMDGDGEFAWPDEAPLHRVRVDGFWMDATEVTNAEFRIFVEATKYVLTEPSREHWIVRTFRVVEWNR